MLIEDYWFRLSNKNILKKLIDFSQDPDIFPILLTWKKELSIVLFLRFYEKSKIRSRIKNITAFFVKSEEFVENIYAVVFTNSSSELKILLENNGIYLGQEFMRKLIIEDVKSNPTMFFRDSEKKDLELNVRNYLNNNDNVKKNATQVVLLDMFDIISILKGRDSYDQ